MCAKLYKFAVFSSSNHLVVEAWFQNWLATRGSLLQSNDPETSSLKLGNHDSEGLMIILHPKIFNVVYQGGFCIRLELGQALFGWPHIWTRQANSKTITWTWSCWLRLEGWGRWRGTRARSCRHRSPTGTGSRICLSSSAKVFSPYSIFHILYLFFLSFTINH